MPSTERRSLHRSLLASLAETLHGRRDGAPRCALVSGCLLGSSCRYDGKGKLNAATVAFVAELRDAGWRIQRMCPEAAGRLPQPRPPAEQTSDGRVVDRDGADVTAFFERGADRTCAMARTLHAELAVGKANSPSCGCYAVYDGTFTGGKVPGMGIAARRLEDEGLLVVDEHDIEWLIGGGASVSE